VEFFFFLYNPVSSCYQQTISMYDDSEREEPSNSENFVIFGTAFPETTEKDRRAGRSDAGQFVPLWKQEAVDEKGRRRFHGAFTGGFSAGYYNTVGSKEGTVCCFLFKIPSCSLVFFLFAYRMGTKQLCFF
jgi:hypothetical protein